MITLGIDIGSTSSKAVILEDGHKVLAKHAIESGTGTKGPGLVFNKVLADAQLTRDDIDNIVVTGYGRMTFKEADSQMSELTCHGKGVSFLLPGTHTIIDIGGQDAKVIRVDDNGFLQDFVMNDKCAAGTGRFLDIMANTLDIDISDLGEISTHAQKELSISNVCTVFAESEVISHLAAGEKIPDIVAGIHKSVAKKVASLGNRIGYKDMVSMSGGVALNKGVVQALENELHKKVVTHPDAQLAGAYGAAIVAYENELKKGK